ncbi:major facilitator superfamily domain-containing protein, partial [Mycotypha africana]|uniref:major facilitator superfamily domain-containing protein n=1 Tax=Mycotypha africana TaxID=64632 RepID=UPI00230154F8
YDSGVTTTVLAMPPFREKYQLDPQEGVGYAIVPVSLAASSVAALLSGYFADSMGRKKFFILASIIHEIGCIVELAGQNHATIIVGRMITGIGVGIFSMLVPLYQSEIAQPENRGRLMTFYQILITFGFFLAFWIGYASFRLDSDGAWLLPIGLQLGAGLLLLIGLWFIPESPRWLIYKGRNDEANKILVRLRSHNYDDDIEVQMEFTGIHIFTQLSGINAILFYLPYILESAGIKEIYSVLLGNGVGGAVNFVATLFVLLYVVLMGLCMIVITIVSAIYNQQLVSRLDDDSDGMNVISVMSNTAASYVLLILLCVFIAIFALSWGPVGWIYPAEIYPQMIRAQAMGVTTFFSYLFNLFVSLASPVMFRNITWGTYLFFGLISLIMAVIVHKLYPETRGRSLEEIQLIFSGALIDQRPDAHHPTTAAEALLHLEQIQHRDKRHQL